MLIGTTYYYEMGKFGRRGHATDIDLDVPEPSGKVTGDTLRVWQCMNGERRISMTFGYRVQRFVKEKGIAITDTWECYWRIRNMLMKTG